MPPPAPTKGVMSNMAPAMTRFPSKQRPKRVMSLGTPGVSNPVKSSVGGPPALGATRTVLFTGTVVSTAMQKTINVEVSQFRLHPKLRAWLRTTTKLMAHDEWEESQYGDVVEIRECRPISKRKRFVLHRIVKPRVAVEWAEAAPQPLTYRTIAQQMQQATSSATSSTDDKGEETKAAPTERKEEAGAGLKAAVAAQSAEERTKAQLRDYRQRLQRRMVARK